MDVEKVLLELWWVLTNHELLQHLKKNRMIIAFKMIKLLGMFGIYYWVIRVSVRYTKAYYLRDGSLWWLILKGREAIIVKDSLRNYPTRIRFIVGPLHSWLGML